MTLDPDDRGPPPLANAMIGCAVVVVALVIGLTVLAFGGLAAAGGVLDRFVW